MRAAPGGRCGMLCSRSVYGAANHGTDRSYSSVPLTTRSPWQPTPVRGDSFIAEQTADVIGEASGKHSRQRIELRFRPESKRIVGFMPAKASQKAQNQVIFLENFFDELRRKVPTGK